MFGKVLVANRGEIAIRAFRAAYELGAHTVAVFPHEDRNSEHRLKADEAYQIGEQGHPVRAYLSVEEIIKAAQRAGVDAGAGEFFASLDDHVPDRPCWVFIRVPVSKAGKNRVHVDLTAADREAEVARLVGLGATACSDHDEWGAVWTTMHDPEGNEFCVGQAR